MDIKCNVCQRFIGRETSGKLYDDKGRVLAEDELIGYCINCRNLVVWRTSGVVTMAEANVPPSPIYTPPVPEMGVDSMLIDEDLPARRREAFANPTTETVANAPIRLKGKQPIPVAARPENLRKPQPVIKPVSEVENKPDHKPTPPVMKPEKEIPVKVAPVFVTFGKSKIYHMVNHFEDKVGTAKVITDTTGYTLCKICDGFVEAMNE